MKRSEQFLSLLENLRGVYDEGPNGRDVVDQLEHSLQMGTRMLHATGKKRMATLAVLHDAFRVVAPLNHGPALAEALSDVLTWQEQAVLKNHSIIQDDIVNGNDSFKQFQDAAWFGDGYIFGQLDAASFDPNYRSAPLSDFEPMIREMLDGSGAS